MNIMVLEILQFLVLWEGNPHPRPQNRLRPLQNLRPAVASGKSPPLPHRLLSAFSASNLQERRHPQSQSPWIREKKARDVRLLGRGYSAHLRPWPQFPHIFGNKRISRLEIAHSNLTRGIACTAWFYTNNSTSTPRLTLEQDLQYCQRWLWWSIDLEQVSLCQRREFDSFTAIFFLTAREASLFASSLSTLLRLVAAESV